MAATIAENVNELDVAICADSVVKSEEILMLINDLMLKMSNYVLLKPANIAGKSSEKSMLFFLFQMARSIRTRS